MTYLNVLRAQLTILSINNEYCLLASLMRTQRRIRMRVTPVPGDKEEMLIKEGELSEKQSNRNVDNKKCNDSQHH